jgi:hypothetical protein
MIIVKRCKANELNPKLLDIHNWAGKTSKHIPEFLCGQATVV